MKDQVPFFLFFIQVTVASWLQKASTLLVQSCRLTNGPQTGLSIKNQIEIKTLFNLKNKFEAWGYLIMFSLTEYFIAVENAGKILIHQ